MKHVINCFFTIGENNHEINSNLFRPFGFSFLFQNQNTFHALLCVSVHALSSSNHFSSTLVLSCLVSFFSRWVSCLVREVWRIVVLVVFCPDGTTFVVAFMIIVVVCDSLEVRYRRDTYGYVRCAC